MSNLEFRIAELERKQEQLIRIGQVAEVDLIAARVRVQIGELLTAPLPWLTPKAGKDTIWWPPEVGEQVMVLSPGGELAAGVVLGAIYQDAFPAPQSADGKLYINVRNGQEIKAPTVTLDADLVVMGKITGGEDLEVSGRVRQAGGHGTPTGVVTGECACQFTGLPHSDVSQSVEASK